MKNDNIFERSGALLPRCRTASLPDEMRRMVHAVLGELFTFSNGEESPYSIELLEDYLVISSESGKEVRLPRPVTANALRDSASAITASFHSYGFIADSVNRSAILGDASVILTPTEFKLFSAILENGNRLSTAEELSRAVWGKFDRNLCTVYLSYLRKKLDCTFGEGTLVSVRGRGYGLRK